MGLRTLIKLGFVRVAASPLIPLNASTVVLKTARDPGFVIHADIRWRTNRLKNPYELRTLNAAY